MRFRLSKKAGLPQAKCSKYKFEQKVNIMFLTINCAVSVEETAQLLALGEHKLYIRDPKKSSGLFGKRKNNRNE